VRGGDTAATLKAAVGFARSAQNRAGFWSVRPRGRPYDTGLAALLFKSAGFREPFLRARAFLRGRPVPREIPLPKPAQSLGLQWEWLLQAGARSLALEGFDKRRQFTERFLERAEQSNESLPPAVAAFYACLAELKLASWEHTPPALETALDLRPVRLAKDSVNEDSLFLAGAALSQAALLGFRQKARQLARSLQRLQSSDGSWLASPALTAFLGFVLCRHAPSSSRRAGRWLAQVQAINGGVSPLAEKLRDTAMLSEVLKPFPEAAPTVQGAERFLARKQVPAHTPPRFNEWHSLADLSIHSNGGWLVRERGPGWEGLEHGQNGDGGWGFCAGLPSNASATANAVLALSRAKRWPSACDGGAWLIRHQRASGTWRFLPEVIGPKPVRYNRPLEGHARCLQALAALETLAQERRRDGAS